MTERRTGELFPAAPDPEPPIRPEFDAIGIAALARRIQTTLKDAFPRRIWVTGEASELERARARRSRHWFFNLAEEDPNDGKTHALGAVLWQSEVRRLFGRGGSLEGVIEPRDGIQIRALCDVDFYPPSGDLRLVVRDIDPEYTLGSLLIEKRRLIERLSREGVLARQDQLMVEEAPLRVGLITAENSAAYQDFVNELLQAELAFSIFHVDAKMQGEQTVAMVRAALTTLDRLGVDVICLIRGGGAAVDLAWFDAEPIARAIANSATPVWTGIGHEIDSSVADLAAHTAFKTPTAVAAALAERGRAEVRGISEASRRLLRLGVALDLEVDVLGACRRRLARAGGDGVASATRDLRACARLLATRAELAIGVPRSECAGFRRRLHGSPVAARLGAEYDVLERAVRRARSTASRHLDRGIERLATSETRARLLDPSHVLRRGFAIVRGEAGEVLKDTSNVDVGRHVVVELRDGQLKAKVEETAPRHPGQSSPVEDSETETDAE